MSDPDLEEDFEEETKTKYVIFMSKKGGWFVSCVEPGTEVGEYDGDQDDARVAAFFDESVEEVIRAMIVLGGDSLEGHMRILDLLSGVCRSFVSAQENIQKWASESAD